MYQPRTYRHWVEGRDLVSFGVVVKETDLYIRAQSNLQRRAIRRVYKYRAQIEEYIEHHPGFLTSLGAISVGDDAPRVVRAMSEAGSAAGVGPMAAVAGAIAECVGKDLLGFSTEIIVENGGDIFLKTSKRRLVGIYAGESSLSMRFAVEVFPQDTPLGVCTSSGTVGHSVSFGRADAVVVLSPSTPLADAVATAVGNIVGGVNDISRAIELAQGIDGVKGVVIIVGDKMGLWGGVRVSSISPHSLLNA